MLRDVVFDGGNIWVANFYAQTITRLSASNGQVLQTIPGAGKPQALVSDGTTVWVGYANSIQRFAISDGSFVANVGSDSVLDLTFDGEYVWASSMSANNVSKYRASDGQKIGQFQPNTGNGQAYGILRAAGHLWVANPYSGTNNYVTKIWPD